MQKPKMVTGILLAAGQSTRFGSNKCLHRLPESGIPIGLQSVITLSKAVDQTICIVPEKQPELEALFREYGYTIVSNSHPEKGISESIKLGIETVIADDQCSGCLIALADMPFITTDTIKLIRQELQKNRGIIAPQYHGKRGHPVGFSADFLEKLMTLNGDLGAKQLIQQNRDQLHLVDVDDPGVIRDIDVLTDLDL